MGWWMECSTTGIEDFSFVGLEFSDCGYMQLVMGSKGAQPGLSARFSS